MAVETSRGDHGLTQPEEPMRIFSFLFARSKREQYLSEYVLREHARGRTLDEILDDRYVQNRSTVVERARLLERREIVEAIGANAVDELRAAVSAAAR
jgi:hypothetical protein